MNIFIKKISKLFTALNKAGGMSVLMEIHEIELLYENHVKDLKELHISNVKQSIEKRIQELVDEKLDYKNGVGNHSGRHTETGHIYWQQSVDDIIMELKKIKNGI